MSTLSGWLQQISSSRHPIQVPLPGGFETRLDSLLTAPGVHGILFVPGKTMTFRHTIAVASLAALLAATSRGQDTPSPKEARQNEQAAASSKPEVAGDKDAGRSDAYFNYTMGHFYEQQFESTSRSEYATQAIDFYKKAYALDPKSPIIGER